MQHPINCTYHPEEPATHILIYGCPTCDYIKEIHLCQHHYNIITQQKPRCPQPTPGPPCGTTLETLHGPLPT